MERTHIPSELIIAEVKKRKCIYNGSKNRSSTEDAWEDLCCALFPEWDDLEAAEKGAIWNEIHKRWRNLRDTFTRTYRIIKSKKVGASKGKQYIYFNQLSFLTPFIRRKQRTRKVLSTPSEQGDSGVTDEEVIKRKPRKQNKILLRSQQKRKRVQAPSEEQQAPPEKQQALPEKELSLFEKQQPLFEKQQPLFEKQQPLFEKQQPLFEKQQPLFEKQQPLFEKQQPLHEKQQAPPEKQQAPPEQQPVQISTPLIFSQGVEEDCDRMFLLSMVPWLKAISPYQKPLAQIAVLEVLQRFLFPSDPFAAIEEKPSVSIIL